MKLALALVTTLFALAGAPLAHATSQQDSLFLHFASERGLTYDDAGLAIAQGKAMCADLDDGYTPVQIIDNSMMYYGLNYEDSLSLTAVSIIIYCPWHDPRNGVA